MDNFDENRENGNTVPNEPTPTEQSRTDFPGAAEQESRTENVYGQYAQPGEKPQQDTPTGGQNLPPFGQDIINQDPINQNPINMPPPSFPQGGQGFAGQYTPPQGMAYGAAPMPGGYYPAAQPQKKKRLSTAFLWGLIAVILILFLAVIVFSIKIAKNTPSENTADPYEGISNTQKAEHTVVKLETADKPVLEDECYQNKETGLLTSVGVAKAILPSQVQIKVFGEVPYAPVSSGSGIIITEDGYILTNAHVVDGANRLSVRFYDDTESEGYVVGMDKKSDLAVISVDKSGLTPAQIGTSSTLVIGEEVALAGAGGGFENTVTYGHVTGLGRKIDTNYINSSTILCIQSDAALNPGNSGGALVNMYGQVVGIAVALMNHETYENIGFSIAIDDAVPIAEDLIAQGYVSSRTRVGITYLSIGDSEANIYGIPSGLCVMDIDPTSGAAMTKLQPYDIITEIDGMRVFGAAEISEALAGKVPGDVITISVFRKEVTGEIKTFNAKLELAADTSSISGYYVNSGTDENYTDRDVIK